jgi:hypothetical protein
MTWCSRSRLENVKSAIHKFQKIVCIAFTVFTKNTPTASFALFLDLLLFQMQIEAETIICVKRYRCLCVLRNFTKYLSWVLFNSSVMVLSIFMCQIMWVWRLLSTKSGSSGRFPCVLLVGSQELSIDHFVFHCIEFAGIRDSHCLLGTLWALSLSCDSKSERWR